MVTKMFYYTLVLIASVLQVSCGGAKMMHPEGKYTREYSRSPYREIVSLRSDGTFEQMFEKSGVIIASNVGKWELITKNSGHSEKWPDGKSIFMFSGWTEYDLSVYQELQGEVVRWSDLPSVEITAVSLGSKTFGFDLDGGSWYEKSK